jgi:hypothetical protein
MGRAKLSLNLQAIHILQNKNLPLRMNLYNINSKTTSNNPNEWILELS